LEESSALDGYAASQILTRFLIGGIKEPPLFRRKTFGRDVEFELMGRGRGSGIALLICSGSVLRHVWKIEVQLSD
jgi:hypothetical protein